LTTNLKIARASIILMAANACVFALGMAKEMIVAARFGIRTEMDAFYAALTIPNLLSGILLTTFSAVFIPVFVRCRVDSSGESNRIASIVINYFIILLLAISSVIFLFARRIIKFSFSGFSGETVLITIKILRLLCLFFIFSSFSGIMTGILNASEKFGIPAISSAIVTLSTILSVLWFRQFGIFALAYGFVAGALIQAILLLFVFKQEYRYIPSFDFRHPAIKMMLKNSLPFFLVIIVSEMNMVIGRMVASHLAPGSIASLGYADKLISVPINVFSGSIATAIFPYFSMQLAEKKNEEMANSLSSSIKMAGFILIPLTVLFTILGRPIIEVLFQRGAFDRQATSLTSAVFICYSFQLFFYTSNIILSKVFLVLQDMWTLLKVVVVGLCSNVLLIFLFIKMVKPPVAGIALAISAANFIIMGFCLFFLKKKFMYFESRNIFISLFRILSASLLSGLVVYAISIIYKSGVDIAYHLAKLLIMGILGVSIFTIFAFIFRIDELQKAEELFRIRFSVKGQGRIAN